MSWNSRGRILEDALAQGGTKGERAVRIVLNSPGGKEWGFELVNGDGCEWHRAFRIYIPWQMNGCSDEEERFK